MNEATETNGDMLPTEMTEYLRSMPDQDAQERIVSSCRDVLARAATSRGDAFSRYSVLILTDHAQIQLRVPVSDLPVSVGRRGDAQLQVDVYGVSRVHCSLEREGPFIRIRDQRSKNGTYVNGVRTNDEQLCIGDRIEIGQCVLLLEVESAPSTGEGGTGSRNTHGTEE